MEARPVVQVVFLLRFAVGGAFAATQGDGSDRWPLGVAAWWCAVVCVYLLNGVMDVAEDRANGSVRPIARGALPVRVASVTTGAFAAAAVVVALAAVPGLIWWILLFLALGAAYSVPPIAAKRSSWACALILTGLGLTTYAAGAQAAGHSAGLEAWVFAGVMAAWMGLVGAVVKDLGDAEGDASAGRRTVAAVHGAATARRLALTGALTVGCCGLAASLWAPAVLVGTVPLAIGSVWVAFRLRKLPGRDAARQERRGAYRAFMVVQYAANAAMLVLLLVRAASR
jgi:4-hydroxybenzoate polyprenyltransferase